MREHLFKIILNSVADGVFTVDSQRRITSFNSAAERITGYPARDAIGRRCYDVFHSDICERGCLLDRTMQTGQEAIDMPVRILNQQGRTVPISISTAVLRDEDGSVLGAVETFRDLSAIENLRKELHQRYSYEDIVTKSPKCLKLINILPDVAMSESTVLIEGASGTGKEVFAKAVHSLSERKDKPYVVINCGAMPPQLFESELFGYVKGAFTDAKRDKAGKVAAAEGGTLFLDEIGELPASTQVKLLRLLQQREYEPVGGVKPVKANIRVVAATNRDLKQAVRRGEFREDLFYRLAVIRFELPPLIERREDIPLLVDHFIRRFNALKGKNILSVSPAYMETLLHHEFPGNVRELENVLEYGFAICKGRTLDIPCLPVELKETVEKATQTPSVANAATTQAKTESKDVSQPLHDLMQQLAQEHATPVREALVEEAAIREALRTCNGNRTHAARALGIDRTTLWRKMKKYEIDEEEARDA